MLSACADGDAAENSSESAGLEKVHLGSIGGLTDAGIYIAQERGYFEEGGLAVERVQMSDSPELMNALAAGELDVAGLSLSVGIFNGIKQNIGIKLVGDKNSHQEFEGTEEPFTGAQLMVRSDLGYETEEEAVEKMIGGSVAITSTVSINYWYLVDLLEMYGHDIEDVTIEEMSMGNVASAFSNGSVDAALVSEPHIQSIKQAGVGVRVSNLAHLKQKDVPLVPITYSEAFAENEELGNAFMVAYMRGVHDYLDAYLGADEDARAEVQSIIAEQSGLDLEVVDAATPGGLSPDQEIAPEMYDDMQEFFVDQGLMDEKVDITDAVDPSFAEYAREELGEYELPEAP